MTLSPALMSPDEISIGNSQDPASTLFDGALRRSLRSLLSEDLIAEHRLRPFGPHGYELTAVLNYFRTSSISGKFALLSLKPMGPFRVIALTGVRGEMPSWASDRIYETAAEGEHAIFLMRIETLLSGN